MKTRLTAYPAEQTDELIAWLFRQIPTFVKGLPSKDALHELYNSLRGPEHDAQYLWYRLQRTLCKGAGVEGTAPPLQGEVCSKAAFIARHRRPNQAQLYHATLMGFTYAMDEVFAPTCTVYHRVERRYHDMGSSIDLAERLGAIAKQRLYSPETDFNLEIILDECGSVFNDGIDLHAFLAFVFTCLHDRGYDWQYRSDHLAFMRRLEQGKVDFSALRGDKSEEEEEEERRREREKWLEPSDPDAEDLAPDAEQYNRTSLAERGFESEYLKFVGEGPEPAVRAYIAVYGVEPDGYPPRMDEY